MLSPSQIVASLHDRRLDGASLPDLLCADCALDLSLTGATLSVGDDSGLVAVVGASGPGPRRLDERQVELGEGPSIDATRSGEPSVHPDLDHTAIGRWPAYAPVALEAGVRAVCAWPLSVVALRVGALGMYRSSPGPWDASTLAQARSWAGAAAVVLLDLAEGDATAGPDEQDLGELTSSVEHTAEIHQATGFVSVTAAVDIDQALSLLRAQAFSSGRSLLEVARDVLAERIRIGDVGGHDG